jgi:outer membrane protein assembly factor BamB/predicted phosphodiesterase
MKSRFRSLHFLAVVIALLVSHSYGQRFRFAWLSDTHVGSLTGEADLRASVHDINSLTGIAFVIVSGDVTEMGSDQQLVLAKAILDSLQRPYHIIPGNHDTKWSESGCTEFGRLWGSDKFTFQFGGYDFIGMHQGPIMKMGDGHFPPEDIRWLDSVLTHLPRKDQPLFFITHYPLDSSIDNWYQVTDRLKQYNTQVALVGHGHRNRVLNFEGIPGVMGRSNLRGRDARGGYTLVDVGTDTISFAERTPQGGTAAPWDKIPLERRDYRADTTTYARPDFSINQQYPNVKLAWRVNTDYTIASTPAVWKDLAIVGNASGTVAAFSLKDGSRRWSFTTHATVYSTPDATDGKVVFGSSDRFIYCLDAESGKLVWKLETQAPVVAAPTIVQGTVYVGGSGGSFRAIDLASGNLKWEFNGVGGFVETKPLVYRDRVIFGAWDTFLYALHTRDGSLAWKWSNGNPGLLFSPAACWPVASDGKIFIAAPDRYLTAINAEDGKTVWRTNRFQVRETVGVSADGMRVYARCMVDTVIAFSPSASSFSPFWAQSCSYGYDIDPSMPIEKDGVLFFGTKNGLIIALDAESGKVLWKHRVGETVVNTLVPLDAHHIIASDLDGRVMLVTAD